MLKTSACLQLLQVPMDLAWRGCVWSGEATYSSSLPLCIPGCSYYITPLSHTPNPMYPTHRANEYHATAASCTRSATAAIAQSDTRQHTVPAWTQGINCTWDPPAMIVLKHR